MQQVNVPAPPASLCLSPIGEDLIIRGLRKEFPMDFVKARTRQSSVFSGHPFMVEAALGYGGKLPPEGNAQILRFANRVPLMYQTGCLCDYWLHLGNKLEKLLRFTAGPSGRPLTHSCPCSLDKCTLHQ